jgi:apolipoprotein N-acyltransferase
MNIIFILFSSLLYVLSFPTWNFWWLSFFSLVPFFAAIERGRFFPNQIFYGAVWSIGISAGLGYWLFSALCENYGVALPKAILFFGLCVFLPLFVFVVGFIACYLFMHRRHLLFYAVIAPSLWTIMEYLKEAIPVMLPWGEIGYAVVPFETFIQIADIGGVHGVTFVVAAINGLVYSVVCLTLQRFSDIALFRHHKGNKHSAQYLTIIAPAMIVFTLFMMPILYGEKKLAALKDEDASQIAQGVFIDAQLIQGNFSLVERWSGMGFYNRIQKYLEMTGAENKNSKNRVIVWPETTLNSTTKLDKCFFLEIMKYIGQDSLLISGGLKEDEKTGGVLNSAYLISGTGQLMRYDKHILLPYAETSPLINLLDQYYTAPNQFQKGVSPLAFQTNNGCAGLSICFEILYPDLIRKSVKQGAEYLVNISNDAWFGRSSMPYTHLNAARLRAIENRRYLLRTSNSGISAIISPEGKVLSQSSLFVCEQVSGQFLKVNTISVYTRFGDIILYVSALFLFAALSVLIMKS